MTQVYTGEGKGKTTAALGLALRAAGAGWRVVIIQFMKGRDSSELRALGKLTDQISVYSYGTTTFVVGEAGGEDRNEMQAALGKAEAVISDSACDMLILDEIFSGIQCGMLRVDEVVSLMTRRPKGMEFVMTGHQAPKDVIDRADLVTEMKAVKHYYDNGVQAREGIEY